jgi:SsrA-binding protein
MARGAQKSTKQTAKDEVKIVTVNRRARFDYEISEKFEAGIVLTGGEIKSIRLTGININEAYIVIDARGASLLNAHIGRYSHDSNREYNALRARRLLLNKHELDKLRGRVEKKGFTIVPLQLYLKGGYAKIEIALAKGKAGPDRRQDIKKRESDREIARAIRGK